MLRGNPPTEGTGSESRPPDELVHKEASKLGFSTIFENKYCQLSKPRLDNLAPCECKMLGKSSCTSFDCDHAGNLVECNDKTCSFGKHKCGNRISQKKQWIVNCHPFSTTHRGRGLRTLVAIPKTSVIGRYLGVVSFSPSKTSNYVMELPTRPDNRKRFVEGTIQ